MTKVSVRLGDLTAAVDREAALAHRTRSEMLRFLIEDALKMRQQGIQRYVPAGPITIAVQGGPPQTFTSRPLAWVERFEGCATPDMGATYQVLEDEWDTKSEPMTRIVRQVRLV